jgi:hypothetical protein
MDCQPIHQASTSEKVIVRLNLTLPNDAFFLVLEDYIPLAQKFDTNLKTSQLGATSEALNYNPQTHSSMVGVGVFQRPQIYDDHITWAVDYLPAGSYELTNTLVTLQPGEYRVLPAHAWNSISRSTGRQRR